MPGHVFAITPHDTNNLPSTTEWIYVGGAGNLAVVGEASSTAVTLTAVPVGTQLFGRFTKVLSTGTTATLLVGGA